MHEKFSIAAFKDGEGKWLTASKDMEASTHGHRELNSATAV